MEEKCKDCGEEHVQLDLKDELKRTTRQYRLMVAGYFISLFVLGYAAYRLGGSFGGLSVLAGFGIYVFHLNMLTVQNRRNVLKGIPVSFSIKELESIEKSKNFSVHGQYL